MRRVTLFLLFVWVAWAQEEPAPAEEAECEEAWSYVEFLKNDVNAKLEDILQKTLYEAKEKRGETVLADTVRKSLEEVIGIRESIITRIKGIRKEEDGLIICEGQNINQEEKLSQFRMDVMNVLLKLVNPEEASVEQLQSVSEALLTLRMNVSREIMRLLMLPQGGLKQKIRKVEDCDCEFLVKLSKVMDRTVNCAKKSGDGEDEAAADGEDSGEACMPPSMYHMELIEANELIDEEVQNLYREIISTSDGDAREKLLSKLTKYKDIRNENEENIAKLMKPGQDDDYYIKIVTRSVKKTQKKITDLKRKCLVECSKPGACPEPGSCAVEVIDDTKSKMEEFNDNFQNAADQDESVQFVRNELMKYITNINEKSTDIITQKTQLAPGEDLDDCTAVKLEVYEKIKGPLWMLVNATIFGSADQVATMIDEMVTLLDELNNMYCNEDEEDETPEPKTDDPNCEWQELEQIKLYLEKLDEVIQTSLFKGANEESRKNAMLGFVDMRKMFDERVAFLFKKGVVCPDELRRIKQDYMSNVNKCMAQFMNPNVNFGEMSRVERITCTKELRNKMETQMIKLLQFEVKSSLSQIEGDQIEEAA